MWANLTNFFNLISSRMVKKTLEPTDLIAVGTKDGKYDGGYKPTVIQFQDLQAQINGRPYKAYTVSLFQGGTTPPAVQVEFENTLEVTATYVRMGNGDYYVTFDKPLFNGPYDYVTISQGYYEDAFTPYNFVIVRPIFFNVIQIVSISGGLGDDNVIGIINGSPCILDVRVYN